MEMFPGDGGDVYLAILGTTQADAQLQRYNGQVAHQKMIDGLVAMGKYQWQALQVSLALTSAVTAWLSRACTHTPCLPSARWFPLLTLATRFSSLHLSFLTY
jgi:hypothetical protein